jgi:hypothetical protein
LAPRLKAVSAFKQVSRGWTARLFSIGSSGTNSWSITTSEAR